MHETKLEFLTETRRKKPSSLGYFLLAKKKKIIKTVTSFGSLHLLCSLFALRTKSNWDTALMIMGTLKNTELVVP